MNGTFVSIIIPAFNEEKYIGSCLESITQLDYPRQLMEVIVVDNGSTDKTAAIAKSFDCRLEVLPSVNVAALRNKGAGIAKGEVLFFLDADCIVSQNWVREALSVLERPEVGVVGSTHYLTPQKSSWVEEAWKYNRRSREGFVSWVSSKNLIIKKAYFEKLSGFEQNLSSSEDWEFCLRMHKELGLRVYSSSVVAVTHCKLRETLADFFRKELWYGREILKIFFVSKGKFKMPKAFAFSLFSALFLIGVVSSIVFGLITKNYFPLLISLVLAIICNILLAFTKTSNPKQAAKLSILFLTFGIARAICILNLNNWLFKGKQA
ncbi:glycosyltransferase [Candidatus Omnitrophota bacterium]